MSAAMMIIMTVMMVMTIIQLNSLFVYVLSSTSGGQLQTSTITNNSGNDTKQDKTLSSSPLHMH
jgi:hypothetical protein